jgi:hypothetical protein
MSQDVPIALREHLYDYRLSCLKLRRDFKPTAEVEAFYAMLQPAKFQFTKDKKHMFLRGLTDLILEMCLPEAEYGSKTVKGVVGEILYKLVVSITFESLSEPSFWNDILIDVRSHDIIQVG